MTQNWTIIEIAVDKTVVNSHSQLSVQKLEIRTREFGCLAALLHMTVAWLLKFNPISSVTKKHFYLGFIVNTMLW